MSASPDKRALKILFSAYWSAAGWKKDHTVAPEDLAYAKAAGLMFEPQSADHAFVIRKAIRAKEALIKQHVVNGFLASLSTRRLEWRSALGSYAAALHLTEHKHTPGSFRAICAICGEFDQFQDKKDISVLNFKRFKWGGVRHSQPFYIGFDLEQFSQLPPSEPQEADIAILRKIFAAVTSLAADAKLTDLEKTLGSVLPSNTQERRNLIGILGYCGILRDKARPSFFEAYPARFQRQDTPWYKDDWPYPVCWWNGSHGISEDAVKHWFGDLIITD